MSQLVRLTTLIVLLLAAPAQAIEPVRIDDGRAVDEQGRQVVLHGINVHYKLAPFLPHDGGGVRTSFTEAEAGQLREWG